MPKKIVLGAGTLTFSHPLSRKELVYQVSAFQIEQPTEIERACGYDPQLLLTDQRTPLRKWSDEHGGYDALIRQIGEQTRKDFADGGAFKPFPYQESMMAAVTSGNEFVIPTTGRRPSPYAYPEAQDFPPLGRRREPTFHTVTMFPRVQPIKFVDIDYAGIEKRILATLTEKDPIIRRIIRARRHAMEQAMMDAIYAGTAIFPSRTRGGIVERLTRIVTLLGSRDPRRRKRGRRLYDREFDL